MGNLKMKSLSALMLFVTMTIFLTNGSLAKNLKKKHDHGHNLKINKNLLQNSLVQTFTTSLLHSGNALTKNPIKVVNGPFHKGEVAALQTKSKDIAAGHHETAANSANVNNEAAVHVNIPAAQAHADAQVTTANTADIPAASTTEHDHSATEEAAAAEENGENNSATANDANMENDAADNDENDESANEQNAAEANNENDDAANMENMDDSENTENDDAANEQNAAEANTENDDAANMENMDDSDNTENDDAANEQNSDEANNENDDADSSENGDSANPEDEDEDAHNTANNTENDDAANHENHEHHIPAATHESAAVHTETHIPAAHAAGERAAAVHTEANHANAADVPATQYHPNVPMKDPKDDSSVEVKIPSNGFITPDTIPLQIPKVDNHADLFLKNAAAH